MRSAPDMHMLYLELHLILPPPPYPKSAEQVSHMSYVGGSGSMSPSSAAMGQGMYAGAGNGSSAGMGPMGLQSPPMGVGIHHVSSFFMSYQRLVEHDMIHLSANPT